MKCDCQRCGKIVDGLNTGIEVDYVFVCDGCIEELGKTYDKVSIWVGQFITERERKRIGKCPSCGSIDTYSVRGGHYTNGSGADMGIWNPELLGCVSCYNEWYGV